MPSTRLRSLAGLALASTVLLTGCSSVPDLNPGVAARVGDETLSLAEVDELTEQYCEAAEADLADGEAIAQHYLRGQVAGNLALRAAAEQFAEEQGVTADESYDAAVEQARSAGQFEGLTEAQMQAIIDVQGTPIYVTAVQQAVGEDGPQLFQAWLEDHDIRIDPRFGVTIEQGQTVPADTSLSVAAGDTATTAGAEEPDNDYALALPDSQRCG